jgi:hypothetical protein
VGKLLLLLLLLLLLKDSMPMCLLLLLQSPACLLLLLLPQLLLRLRFCSGFSTCPCCFCCFCCPSRASGAPAAAADASVPAGDVCSSTFCTLSHLTPAQHVKANIRSVKSTFLSSPVLQESTMTSNSRSNHNSSSSSPALYGSPDHTCSCKHVL